MTPNPFAPAVRVKKPLKVLAYGGPGTGKTWFALTFPAVAVLDTEGGTELYGGRDDIFPFHVVRAKDYQGVMATLDWIAEDNGHTYDTLVVDPVTVLYQVLQEAAERRSAAGDGAIDGRGWGEIRRMLNALYVRLLNLPLHVVIVARQKDLYDRDGSDLLRVGVGPDSDRQAPYLFDVVLRFEHTNGQRCAVVEKDRSGTLPGMIENISFADLRPIAEAHTEGVIVYHATDADAATSWAEAMDARPDNGRYTRPMAPSLIREILARKVANNRVAGELRRGTLIAIVNRFKTLFEGLDVDAARHVVQAALVGKDSLTAFTEAEGQALRDWLLSNTDDDALTCEAFTVLAEELGIEGPSGEWEGYLATVNDALAVHKAALGAALEAA
jgi:hypothetical protein